VSGPNPSPTPDPAPEQALSPAPPPASPPPPVDLNSLLLPTNWSPDQLAAEARRVYFQELVTNPPRLAVFPWLGGLPLEVTNTEGWVSYHHQRTGELDPERLRRVNWIRPVLEMRAAKTKIYVNSHSMKPREFGPKARAERKRLYIVTQSSLLYFISLKYLEKSLVLTTAFPPTGRWLREMQQKHGTTLLGPP